MKGHEIQVVFGCELHVYCGRCYASAQFSGSTKSEAFRRAMDAGWKIKQKDRTALCWQCKRNGDYRIKERTQ